jgi:fructose-1,6-bisphosphatase I
MQLEQTFMNFLIEHQRQHKRTLNFLILMESIMTAARYIQFYYQTGGLHRALGEAGQINVQHEQVMRMDMMANQIVMHYLKESNQVIEVTSEEVDEEVVLNENGRYFIYFDPLDGSSNIAHSLPVGFLFGIAKRNLEGPEDNHLRPGCEFIASGMFVIPVGVFTFALKDSGTWRFLQDQNGVYIRPTRIVLPDAKKTWELSYNTANRRTFSDPVQKWIEENESKYSFRYTGSLAVDIHRLLDNGGMFMYPAIVNHPDAGKNRPEGKLRLMYECAVVAFIIHEAGGIAVNERGEDILAVKPIKRHQRSAIYIGSREPVSSIGAALKAHAEQQIRSELDALNNNAQKA